MGKSTGQWPCIGQWRGVIGGISHWRVDWNRSAFDHEFSIALLFILPLVSLGSIRNYRVISSQFTLVLLAVMLTFARDLPFLKM
jgi:hypothetical protein